MRGILFQPDMVRQLLAKRKWHTRRIIKPEWWRCLDPEDEEDRAQAVKMCPYGKPGGVLAVREAWRAPADYNHLPPRDIPACPVHYEADGAAVGFGRYRHARFMPLARSRLHLTLSSVKIDRVLDITEKDAIAEGFPDRAAFLARWDEINGPGNPWVWVLGL